MTNQSMLPTQKASPQEIARLKCENELIEHPTRLRSLLHQYWDEGCELPENQKFYFGYLDCIEADIRFYLYGLHKTLHRCLSTIQHVSASPQRECLNEIDSVFESVEQIILSSEYYELMPKFKKAKAKILKRLDK